MSVCVYVRTIRAVRKQKDKATSESKVKERDIFTKCMPFASLRWLNNTSHLLLRIDYMYVIRLPNVMSWKIRRIHLSSSSLSRSLPSSSPLPSSVQTIKKDRKWKKDNLELKILLSKAIQNQMRKENQLHWDNDGSVTNMDCYSRWLNMMFVTKKAKTKSTVDP